MIASLFKQIVGSEIRGSEHLYGSSPPPPPTIHTATASNDEDPNQGMYMKVRHGKFVGWERIN